MTESTAQKPAEMRDNFPEPPEPVREEPTLHSLLGILKYLMECSQTHESDISDVNLLFVCLTPLIYANYTSTAYPTEPVDPGQVANYAGTTTEAERAQVKAQFEYNKKLFLEVKNMNKALTETFLALIPAEFTKQYKADRLRNPNELFRNVFDRFVNEYGITDENDRKANKERMEAEWHPNDGIQTLIGRIDDGIEFAHYAGAAHRISDSEAVDIALRTITRCGLFEHDYELWQQRQDHSWLGFKTFWKARMRLKKRCTRAGQLGFGMAGIQEAAETIEEANLRIEEQNRQYADSVAAFGAAHAATQDSVQTLAATNTSLTNNVASSLGTLQQQMNLLQQQFAAMASAPPVIPSVQTLPPTMMQAPYAGATAQLAQQQAMAPYQMPVQHQTAQQSYRPYNPNGGRGRGGRGGRGRGAGRGGYGGRGRGAVPNQAQTNYVKRYENDKYCWTHGADLPDDHDGFSCRNPAVGHIAAAHRYNAMGGSPKGSHKYILPSGRTLQPCVGCGPARSAAPAQAPPTQPYMSGQPYYGPNM